MNEPDDNTEETESQLTPLTWLVEKSGFAISSGGIDKPGQVHIVITASDYDEGSSVYLPVWDAQEALTHALAHMGGGIDRADTSVAQVAMELCKHEAAMREQVEKRLADLQGKYALQARHLGEYMGRLKQYETVP